MGYSPWSCKELVMAECLHTLIHEWLSLWAPDHLAWQFAAAHESIYILIFVHIK